MGVERSLINVVESRGRSPGRGGGEEFTSGMKVEARYRGKSRYYPGRIAHVHRDGSCDIDYDDGEKEQRVEPSLIKSLEPAGGGRSSPGRGGGGRDDDDKLEAGTKVEARYRGKSRYYPGTISRAHLNGTYDIDYDDGEKEMGVERSLINVLEPAGGGRGGGV